jgi:hypothetical protein
VTPASQLVHGHGHDAGGLIQAQDHDGGTRTGGVDARRPVLSTPTASTTMWDEPEGTSSTEATASSPPRTRPTAS